MNKVISKVSNILLVFYFLFSPAIQIQPYLVQANTNSGSELLYIGPELVPSPIVNTNLETGSEVTSFSTPAPTSVESLGPEHVIHKIEVCFINIDENGNILDKLPEKTKLKLPFYQSPVLRDENSLLPAAYGDGKVHFEMDENQSVNSQILSASTQADSYCTNIEIKQPHDQRSASYAYGEVEIDTPLDKWQTSTYHDGHAEMLTEINMASEYSNELFRITDGQGDENVDSEERNTLSDGHILMTKSKDNERRIVVINRLEKRIEPKRLEVCFVTVNHIGEFMNGYDLGNGTNYRIDLYSDLNEYENGLPVENESKIFETVKLASPYENNTQIFSDENDSYCKQVEFWNEGKHIGYSQASVKTNHSVYLPKYTDSFTNKVTDLNQFSDYSPELFDGLDGNENNRNKNSDGHIVINENGNPRRLLILTELNKNNFIGEINMVDRYGNDIDGFDDDFGELNTEYLNEDTVDSRKYWSYKIKNNNPEETKFVRFSWDGFNWEPQGGFGPEIVCPGTDISADDKLCNEWNGEEVQVRSYGPEKERKLTRFMEIRDGLGNIRIDTKNLIFDMTEPAVVKVNSQSAFKYDSTNPPTRLDENGEMNTWLTFLAIDRTNARSDKGNKIPQSETSGIYQFRYRRLNIEENGEWLKWQPYDDDTLHSEFIYWSKFIRDICKDEDKLCNPELSIQFQFKDRARNISNTYGNSIRYFRPNTKSEFNIANFETKETKPAVGQVTLEYDLEIDKNGNGTFKKVKENIPQPIIDSVEIKDNKAFLKGRAFLKEYIIRIQIKEKIKLDENCNWACTYQTKITPVTYTKRFTDHWMNFYKDGSYNREIEVGANYINEDGTFTAVLDVSNDNNLYINDWIFGKAKLEGVLKVRGVENSNRSYELDFKNPNNLWSPKSNYVPIRTSYLSELEQKYYTDAQIEAGNYSNYSNQNQIKGMWDIKPGKNGSKFFGNIKNLIELGIVDGNSYGYYEEFNGVSREQMAKFIINGLGLSNYECAKGQKYFTDVHENNKFKNEINLMYCLGITSGYSDGTFRPENLVTRGEAAKFLVLALGVKHNLNMIDDYGTTIPIQDIYGDMHESNVFSKYIKVLKRVKVGGEEIMKGYTPASPGAKPDFKPINYITRGQMAKIIDLARQWHPNKQSEAIFNFEFSDTISDKTNISRTGPIEYHSCGAYFQEYAKLGQYGKSIVFVKNGEDTAYMITGDVLKHFRENGGCNYFGYPTSAEWQSNESVCGLTGSSQHFSKRQIFRSAAHTTSMEYTSRLYKTFKDQGYEQTIGWPIESYNSDLDDLFNDKFPEAADGFDGDAEWIDGMRFEKGIIGVEQDPGYDDGYFAEADYCEEVEEFIFDRIPWDDYILTLPQDVIDNVKHWGPSNLPSELEGYYEEGWEDTPVPMYNPFGGFGMEHNDLVGNKDMFGGRKIGDGRHDGVDLRPTYFAIKGDSVTTKNVVEGYEDTLECLGKKYTFDLTPFGTVTKSYIGNTVDKKSVCSNQGWLLMQEYVATKKSCHTGAQYDSVIVYATHDGIITDAIEGSSNLVCTSNTSKSNAHGYGRYITIHNLESDHSSLYAHLWVIFVEKGDYVRAGQPIGILGNAGSSFGRHLHYEVCEQGDCSWSIPKKDRGKRVDPIEENYLPI